MLVNTDPEHRELLEVGVGDSDWVVAEEKESETKAYTKGTRGIHEKRSHWVNRGLSGTVSGPLGKNALFVEDQIVLRPGLLPYGKGSPFMENKEEIPRVREREGQREGEREGEQMCQHVCDTMLSNEPLDPATPEVF